MAHILIRTSSSDACLRPAGDSVKLFNTHGEAYDAMLEDWKSEKDRVAPDISEYGYNGLSAHVEYSDNVMGENKAISWAIRSL